MTEYAQKIRVNRVEEPRVRIRVKPRVPPLEIEMQNTGSVIQWRLGTTGTWQDLIAIDDIDASISVGSVTTLAPGQPAAVTNVGTAQDVILNFALPAGFDGQVVDITAGLGVTVDSTNPAHPIVAARVQSVATLTGAITAAALKVALAIAVADITDASANGRSLISAASYAAMKTLLAIAQADVSGLTSGSSPQFAGVELGHASDTTLSRAAAGRVSVEGNPILLSNTEQQSVAGGANVTVKSLGNLTGASITPNPGDRPIQKVTNNGAGSILPGSNEGQYTLEVINASGAGTITTTGWTLRGDSFDTTTTSKFLCSCIVTSDMKVMTIVKVA